MVQKSHQSCSFWKQVAGFGLLFVGCLLFVVFCLVVCCLLFGAVVSCLLFVVCFCLLLTCLRDMLARHARHGHAMPKLPYEAPQRLSSM